MTRADRNAEAATGTMPRRTIVKPTPTGTKPTGTPGTAGGYGGRMPRRPSGDKGQGYWRTVSPNYRTAATIDSRWSK